VPAGNAGYYDGRVRYRQGRVSADESSAATAASSCSGTRASRLHGPRHGKAIAKCLPATRSEAAVKIYVGGCPRNRIPSPRARPAWTSLPGISPPGSRHHPGAAEYQHRDERFLHGSRESARRRARPGDRRVGSHLGKGDGRAFEELMSRLVQGLKATPHVDGVLLFLLAPWCRNPWMTRGARPRTGPESRGTRSLVVSTLDFHGMPDGKMMPMLTCWSATGRIRT